MVVYHNLHFTVGGTPIPPIYRVTHDKMESDYEKTPARYGDKQKAYDGFAVALE
jgi:hypothetical protein